MCKEMNVSQKTNVLPAFLFFEISHSYKLITVKRSISGKDNYWDNTVADSFFKNLKMEWAKNDAILLEVRT